MVAVTELQLEQFLKHQAANLRGVLIHGNEGVSVSSLMRTVVGHLDRQSGSAATVVRIEAAGIKSDPAVLFDEVASRSLLGDRIVVLVSNCSDSHVAAVRQVVDAGMACNLLLLEAESLSKTSKLRELCEQAPGFASVALYEDSAASLKIHLDTILKDRNLAWDHEAEEVFLERVGLNRAAAISELNKLVLYCHGHAKVTVADIEAVCGGSAEFSSDTLVDAVLTGDLTGVDRMLGTLDRSSSQASGLLLQILFYLQRLQGLRFEMSAGATLDTAIARAKPPVFFKRKPAITKQLRQLDLNTLEELILSVSAAVFESRRRPSLAEPLIGRTLFSIANRCRSL